MDGFYFFNIFIEVCCILGVSIVVNLIFLIVVYIEFGLGRR